MAKKTKTQKSSKSKGIKKSQRETKRKEISFAVDYYPHASSVEKGKGGSKGRKKVKASLKGDYFFDFAANIGSGGVFIRTTSPLKIEQVLTLKFTIPGTNKNITTKGKVIWVQEHNKDNPKFVIPGMGIQFVDLPHEKRQDIQNYINNNENNDIENESDNNAA